MIRCWIWSHITTIECGCVTSDIYMQTYTHTYKYIHICLYVYLCICFVKQWFIAHRRDSSGWSNGRFCGSTPCIVRHRCRQVCVTNTHTYKHTCAHSHILSLSLSLALSSSHAHTHSLTHTNTHTGTGTHTHTHTRTHILHRQISMPAGMCV